MTSSSNPADAALRAGIVILTLATALIHLQLNFPDPVFILNGLGYLGLLAALFLPRFEGRRNAVRWTLVGYAALTIVLWVLLGARTFTGYADKVIEIALIVLLIVDARRENTRAG